MRCRRRRLNLRRQDSLFLQPGADLLLDDTPQGGSQSQDVSFPSAVQEQPGGSTASQPAIAFPGAQSFAPGSLQMQSQTLAGSSSVASSDFSDAPTSTILFSPSSLTPVVPASTSFLSSSSFLIESSNASPGQVSTSSAAASAASDIIPSTSVAITNSTASPNASQSSSVVSPTPNVDATGHSTVFYIGIVFISIVVFACLLSFSAWLLRSRRNRPSWCGRGREDGDFENQGSGFGLGLHLEKPLNGAGSLNVSPTPPLGAVHNVRQLNQFVLPLIPGLANSPGRYPTLASRPPAAHFRTNDTVESPGRLLGPLNVKNYMPGDFSSSCDEAMHPALSPCFGDDSAIGLGTPHNAHPDVISSFLDPGSQNLSVPWAPLNIRSLCAPERANAVYSLSRRGVTMNTESEDEICSLPMPPFGDTLVREEEGTGTTDGWGTTLRSSILSALSSFAGGPPRPAGDKYTTLPPSRPRSGRWRETMFLNKNGGAEVVSLGPSSDILSDTRESPMANVSGRPFRQSCSDVTGVGDSILGRSLDPQDGCNWSRSVSPATPLRLQKKNGGMKHGLHMENTLGARAIYTPAAGAQKRKSGLYASGTMNTGSKGRGALPQSVVRPAFLRDATDGSATSFSSEASRASRDLTHDELLAKRMLMLRARRKRGMSTGARRRLTSSSSLGRY